MEPQPPAAAAAAPSPPRERQAKKVWLSESYELQSKTIWPGRGQHILAQFDEDSIVVYQAYKKQIAAFAAENKKFEGAPGFSTTRMTWIKPNFLWMMFRSNWGFKPNQDHVLAIWLKREAFERYLENAREKGSVRGFQGTVRLQWDPDHFPDGSRHPYRRAVQLGLRGVTSFVDGSDIVAIQDISEFVHEQGLLTDAAGRSKKKKAAKKKEEGPPRELMVARERVYEPTSKLAAKAVELSAASDGGDGEREED